MGVYVLLGLSILFNLIGGFVIWNLLKKSEVAEDIIIGFQEYLQRISAIIEVTDKKITEIDHRGIFENDDDIGTFFNQIKEIQDNINEFKIENL